MTEIDVAIVDIFMPGVDGLELLTHFYRSKSVAKVIAVSGGGPASSPDSPLETARVLGAVATFAKPFQFDELLECVRQCTEG